MSRLDDAYWRAAFEAEKVIKEQRVTTVTVGVFVLVALIALGMWGCPDLSRCADSGWLLANVEEANDEE